MSDDADDDSSPWDDEEDDLESECGRWDNGRLVFQCRLVGSEWCDWECPIGLPKRKSR
jgi:hypothetical protein